MFGIKCLWEQAHKAGIQCQGSGGDNWPLFKMNHRRTYEGPLWVAVLEERKKGEEMYLCILGICCFLLIKIYPRGIPLSFPRVLDCVT